jgi:hypothetical protein
MRRWMLIFVVLLLVGSACSSGGDDAESVSGVSADMEDAGGDGGERASVGQASYDEDGAVEGPVGAPEPAALGDSAASGGSSGAGGGDAVGERDSIALPSDQKIIKTADIEVEVGKEDVDDAVQDAIALAERHGGFVLSTTLDQDKKASATVAIRVPSEEFESALGDLKGVGKLLSETVQGRDVSEEFVDLQARLRNLEAQETVLLRLYDRAQSVADTIRIQREVQDVQLEIERHRGRLRFLEDRTSLSTIGVRFTEVGAAPKPDVPPSGAIAKAWEQAKDLALGVVSGVIVATGFVVPVGLLAMIAFLLFRALRPRFEAPQP